VIGSPHTGYQQMSLLLALQKIDCHVLRRSNVFAAKQNFCPKKKFSNDY